MMAPSPTPDPKGARDGERGFTLSELVVVMIILSILLAALVYALHGSKRVTRNNAVATAAATFQAAAASYLNAYPVNTAGDPLLQRGGSSAPFGPNDPTSQGLYGRAGDALVPQWPTNPWSVPGGAPTRVLRGTCGAGGAAGDVLLCRPIAGDSRQVRVIAWGKDSSGATTPVFDSVRCSGKCIVP